MTTRNIDIDFDAQRALNAEIAQRVRDRKAAAERDRKDLDNVLSNLRTDDENARIAAAAMLQRIHDEATKVIDLQVDVDEELGQLDAILGNTVPPLPSVKVTPAAAGSNADNIIASVDPNANAPVQVQPTATQPQPVVRTAHPLDPRHWSKLQWLFAGIFGLIGLFVGSKTFDFPGYDNTALKVVFAIFWILATTAVGFFGGGYFGVKVFKRIQRRRRQRRS